MQFRINSRTAVGTKLCFTQIGKEPQRFSWRLSSDQEILSISKKGWSWNVLEVDLKDQMGRDPVEEEHLIVFGNDGASHHLSSPQVLVVALALQRWVEYFLTAPPKDLCQKVCHSPVLSERYLKFEVKKQREVKIQKACPVSSQRSHFPKQRSHAVQSQGVVQLLCCDLAIFIDWTEGNSDGNVSYKENTDKQFLPTQQN